MFSGLYQDVSPPAQGEIYTLAHSTTAARYETPPAWLGNMVTFSSSGSDLYVSFGNGAVKIESAEVSVVVGETLASNWASGFVVPAGASISVPVSAEQSHFCVDSSGATGVWSAYKSSGCPTNGEPLDQLLGKPLLWLDAGARSTLKVTSGAVTVETWRCKVNGYEFTEASAYPDLIDAAAAGTGLIRPAVSFVAGSSEKLVCSDATLAAALGSTNAFTLVIAARRAATGALHTYFSVGTGATNDGRWDFTVNASEDPIVTRVTAAGASTTSTYAATINGMNVFVLTFDGTTPLLYTDRTSQALTGTAAGDVGTTTKVAVGCRAYNTSTFDQFATAEISEVMVFGEAFSAGKLDNLHAWLKRRFGK